MLIKNKTWDAIPTVHAMNILRHFSSQVETPDQRAWMLDRVLRALTSCPVVIKSVMTSRGDLIEVEMLGESAEYINFINDHPEWDRGVPP